MSDDFERTPGGAVLMDGKRLRDETVARIRDEGARRKRRVHARQIRGEAPDQWG